MTYRIATWSDTGQPMRLDDGAMVILTGEMEDTRQVLIVPRVRPKARAERFDAEDPEQEQFAAHVCDLLNVWAKPA